MPNLDASGVNLFFPVAGYDVVGPGVGSSKPIEIQKKGDNSYDPYGPPPPLPPGDNSYDPYGPPPPLPPGSSKPIEIQKKGDNSYDPYGPPPPLPPGSTNLKSQDIKKLGN